MSTILRVVLAVILGVIVGSAVNMSLIMVSGRVIPPPTGADVASMEGLTASLHLFEPKHFVFPFLAHALGTAVGAFITALLAGTRSAVSAYIVGGVFLIGGVANTFMLPAPVWFVAVDLIFAYLPAAALGYWAAKRIRSRGGA